MAIKEQNGSTYKYFFDDSKTLRWIDAFGPDVVKYISSAAVPCDDATLDPTDWVFTMTEGGGTTSVLNAATAGQWLKIVTAGNEYDGPNMQLKGEKFKLDTSYPLYFGCKLTVPDATQSDFLIGIAETDTTLLNASSSHAIAVTGDGVFFSKLDGGTTIAFKNYLDGAETNTANYGTACDTSAHVYEFYWNGSSLKGYIDNTLVGTFTASLADGDMTPSFCYRAGASGADTVYISWLRCIQLR